MFPTLPEGRLQVELLRGLPRDPSHLISLAMIYRKNRVHPQQVCRQHQTGGAGDTLQGMANRNLT